MNTRLLLLLVPLVAAVCAQSVNRHSMLPPSASMRSLREAEIFALYPVGEAGKTSEEERLFKAIFTLEQNKAKQELNNLYSSGNPQAMSYSLVGMRKLDRKRYAELLAAARTSNLTVTTMWGCIVVKEKLRTVAYDLDSGKYDSWLRWMRP